MSPVPAKLANEPLKIDNRRLIASHGDGGDDNGNRRGGYKPPNTLPFYNEPAWEATWTAYPQLGGFSRYN